MAAESAACLHMPKVGRSHVPFIVRASSPPAGQTPPADLRTRLALAFPHASDATLGSLAESARLRPFRRGERLIVQGEPLAVILLIDGWVALRRTSSEGKQAILVIMAPGEMTGAALGGSPDSPVEVVTISDGLAASWTADFVRHLASANACLALDLMDAVMARGLALISRIDGCLFHGVERRLARALATFQDLAFDERRPALTRSDLAALVGASREMTGRALRKMEAEGILARVGRTGLRLLDPARLEEIADHGRADARGTGRGR
jgi:CRP-like cAMP-binding protein